MTTWLRKRLTLGAVVTLVGGALLWNSGALRAQDNERRTLGINTPRVPLSRDEAARQFAQLLDLVSQHQRVTTQGEPGAAMMSSFSRKSEGDLGESLGELVTKMAAQWKQPQQDVRVQSETDSTATVTVDEQAAPVTRPFVLIREGDSWGVDVFETYALWNGLQGSAKTAMLSTLTKTMGQAKEASRRVSCQSNLKQIALGIAQYTQDYDEKLPPAKPWIDVLQPYLKSEQLFRCPAVTDTRGYGYAYNSKLSQKPLAGFSASWRTVSIYETSDLKRNAYGLGENLAFRHQGGANYAFVDGHVKWFDKNQIPSFKSKP
jgi:prepilin-type processing-associated H-X9-DG protein